MSLFGSYFPVWILCGVLGAIAAAATRILFVATGLSEAIPAQLIVCTAVGAIVACAAWLWLGQ
ncbi:MAG: YtcA family lipoprotein [Gammaproteobacteria bacterium]